MSQLTSAQKEKFFRISFPTMCLISLSLAVLTVLPSSREFIRSVIVSNSRQVLAKAEGDLTGKGMKVAVIKVKTADTIALEIFESQGDTASLQFVKRIVLQEKRDAFFNFRGNATNLALTDVDNDGKMEIVAPTFDDNLIPRLNVYKYDPEFNDFRKLGPGSFEI